MREQKMPSDADRQRRDSDRLRDGTVVEMDSRLTRGERAGAGRGRNDFDVDAEVASTISVVRQVASVLIEQQETIRRQEELLYDQRQSIGELQHQMQTAAGELAESERTGRAERERADRAEARLQSGEAQIRRLEDYCVSLKSHLNSLMGVVRDTLAVGDTIATPRA